MSIEIILCITKGNENEARFMEEKARQYGLDIKIKELNEEEVKNQPGLPYFSTDYGTYLSFESLLH